MPILAIRFFSSITDIIFTFSIKKTLIFIQNQKLWLFASKIFIILKSFNNKLIIKESSLKAISWATSSN